MKAMGLKTILVSAMLMLGTSVFAHSHESHDHSGGDHSKHGSEEKKNPVETKAEAKTGEIITVSVNGMVCSFCSTNIENKLKKNKEVQSVKVDLDKKKVEITLKEGQKFADEKIKNEIKKSGYSVVEIKRG